MRLIRSGRLIALVALAAACTDSPQAVTPPPPDPTPDPPNPVGVYSFTLRGIGTENMSSSVSVPDMPGVSPAFAATAAGIAVEQVASSSFTEGLRTEGGVRYVNFTFRVRNMTGGTLNNLTLMLVHKPTSLGGTSISSLKKFDGTNASASIAPLVIPTGAVTMGADLATMQATYPDVIQVLTSAEAAAVPKPAGVDSVFQVGFMVRSKNSNANRTLPNTSDANEFGGLLTVSFRLPLQATSALDVFSLGFDILAVTDSETRLTESIEESQDTAAVRRLRDRATALGATTVTVLNGSPAMDAAITDYPGQRQICSARVSGPSGAPTSTLTTVGAYSTLAILMPGESVHSCNPYFRTGTSGRPATNVFFAVGIRAMDRYGNVKTTQVDTVHLSQVSGPPYSVSAKSALVSGATPQTVLYNDYGTSLMRVVGRRLRGERNILIAGVTRNWTAGAGTTNWNTPGNWSPAAIPMNQDSVYIPAAAPLDPALVDSVLIQGVTVEDVALISLGAFDMYAGGNVTTGLNGGITNTTGRLFLTGTARTVQGVLPTIRVSGTYSLTGNVVARAPIQVDAGRLTASGFRLQATSN
jgi:hypothetical protein